MTLASPAPPDSRTVPVTDDVWTRMPVVWTAELFDGTRSAWVADTVAVTVATRAVP